MITKYFIFHCLQTSILPPGCIILWLFIGFFLYQFSRKIALSIILISILSLWLFSTPIIAYNLIEQLQNQYPAINSKTLPTLNSPYSAIVVLGAGDDIYVEENNKHAVSDTELNRLRYAAYFHKKTRLPIIVSGGYVNGSTDSEATLMSTALQDNFSIMQVIKEEQSTNTQEESQALIPILKQHGFTTIYLITNAWHMPRSIAIFKQQTARVIPAPMGYKVYDHHYSLLSYLPDIHALVTTHIAMHEYIGLLWYHLSHKK